jgi:AraC-like DNA-binding protein/mannose-6-phosphate isomerase-like protein (cupin superfamily)
MASPSRDHPGVGSWRREQGTVVRRATTVTNDTPLSFVIFAEAETNRLPLEYEPHSHPTHELVWVRDGTLTSRIDKRLFTVSDGYALWLPAETVHAGRLTANAQFYGAYFAPHQTPVAFEGPTTIAMTPVLESLLTHLSRNDLDAAARTRAESVVFDVLEPSEQQLTLQLPGDARINPIAEALLDNPADNRALDDWARTLGMSERTVTRVFRHTTGLSFAQWRQVLRVHRALTLLSDGYEVQAASEVLGYAQPSTFIDAFRRVMGTTPGAFIAAAQVPRQMS